METSKLKQTATNFTQKNTGKILVAILVASAFIWSQISDPNDNTTITGKLGQVIDNVKIVSDEYEAQRKLVTDELQKLCGKWQNVSREKIKAKVDGLLNEDRVNEWNQNLTFNCSTVQAPVGFMVVQQ